MRFGRSRSCDGSVVGVGTAPYSAGDKLTSSISHSANTVSFAPSHYNSMSSSNTTDSPTSGSYQSNSTSCSVTPSSALTPQTTNTSVSTSATVPDLPSPDSNTIQDRLAEPIKLQGVILYPHWAVDLQMEEQWGLKNAARLRHLARGVVKHRFGARHEFMWSFVPQSWFSRHKTTMPSIVISVADLADRQAVKNVLKKQDWLQRELIRCGLRLLVVVDPAKFQSSKECTTQTGVLPTVHTATLTTGSSLPGHCASSISMDSFISSRLGPEESTSSFTLGGTIIVDNAVYGLTTGHAFLPLDFCPADSPSREYFRPQRNPTGDIEEWLDDPNNPLVFAGEEELSAEFYAGGATGDCQLTTILDEDVSKPCIVQPGLGVLHDPCSYPVEILTTMTNKPDIRTSTSDLHSCDWGLVQLPPASPTFSNTYVEFGTQITILGSVPDTMRPSGRVKVLLPNDQIIYGHLRANAASYQLGQYDLDVRMVYLDEILHEYIK